MTILNWVLSTAPATTPEYWLLFVDGSAWCSLVNQAPYTGSGAYSVDLTKLDRNVQIIDGLPHNFSVALVGGGVVGPQSSSVTGTIPISVGTITAPQRPVPPVWPAPVSISVT